MLVARVLLAAGLAAWAIGLAAAAAEDATTCAGFAWSVVRERAAFAAPDLSELSSGAALAGGTGAARVVLKPAAEAALPVPNERADRPGTFAGIVTAAIPAAGVYQVTVSDNAWVDLSQDGRTLLKPTAISGKADCPGVRKSVRFALDAGPATIQIARAPGPRIDLDLVKAE